MPDNPLFSANWALISVVFLCLVIAAFFWSFERRHASTKVITLIATMAALAGVGRVPFAMVPGLQPTTFLVMITGYVFGGRAGFMVGALAALVSNFFLGQGPWTPWQMFTWGLSGFTAALFAGKDKRFKRRSFIILAAFWGYFFGWIMNVWHWVGFIYPLTWETFLATYLASFPFDTLHAVGNATFSLLFGKTFYNILERFRKKCSVTLSDLHSID